MPLDYSGDKAAVGNNIKTELGAGRPQKQAEAIALSVQRRDKPRVKRGKSIKSEISTHMNKLRLGLRT